MLTDAAFDALLPLVEGRLTRSKPEVAAHGRSESWFDPAPPEAVAYPLTTEEVAAVMRVCHAHQVPVTAFGAGTSLEGQTLATQGGLTLDFSRMNRIIAINEADLDCVVQPGVTREALEIALRDTGLMFPVDPGANATIGGMAMTRASGTTAVRYGTMRDNVLGLKAVLADGTVIETGSRARKSSAGYDLTGLLVGSEGTLALVTEVTLRLHGQPEAITTAISAFPTMESAVAAVVATIQSGIPMARIEFLDSRTVTAVNAYANAHFRIQPHLLVEFHGAAASVEEQAESFGEIARDFAGSDFEWARHAEDRRALWTMRHNAYYACLALRTGARALVTDICVPISKLADAVNETAADIAASRIDGPILGHVGDGNFHAILLVDPADPLEIAEARRLAHRMAQRALRMGGTVTGEHGVGLGKRGYMTAEHGDGWQVMGRLKAALDPGNILNPGKLVP